MVFVVEGLNGRVVEVDSDEVAETGAASRIDDVLEGGGTSGTMSWDEIYKSIVSGEIAPLDGGGDD